MELTNGQSVPIWKLRLTMSGLVDSRRITWVDYAKGICIVLVVLMHSTLGVEKATEHMGWLSSFIAWARPFRMPDFFLISGLFLASRIDRPWRAYLDSKVIHFVYFYVLWMTIQFAFRGYGIFQSDGAEGLMKAYLLGFIEPYGTLWFIYLLAVFFILTKMLRQVPAPLIFAGAAILEMLPIETGWMVLDETAARFVYFFTGYWLSSLVFALAAYFQQKSISVLLGLLVVWGTANAAFVVQGLAALPGFSLILGFVGAGAVVMTAVVLERLAIARLLRYCGQNSIVIYLAFFMFMAPMRIILLKMFPNADIGLISLSVTLVAVAGPLLLHYLVKPTALEFLFVRPQWARLYSPVARWHTRRHDQPKPRNAASPKPHIR
jgi:uncharacterized membrane protein YcfT